MISLQTFFDYFNLDEFFNGFYKSGRYHRDTIFDKVQGEVYEGENDAESLWIYDLNFFQRFLLDASFYMRGRIFDELNRLTANLTDKEKLDFYCKFLSIVREVNFTGMIKEERIGPHEMRDHGINAFYDAKEVLIYLPEYLQTQIDLLLKQEKSSYSKQIKSVNRNLETSSSSNTISNNLDELGENRKKQNQQSVGRLISQLLKLSGKIYSNDEHLEPWIDNGFPLINKKINLIGDRPLYTLKLLIHYYRVNLYKTELNKEEFTKKLQDNFEGRMELRSIANLTHDKFKVDKLKAHLIASATADNKDHVLAILNQIDSMIPKSVS